MHVQKFSRIMKGICSTLIAIIPLLLIFIWMNFPAAASALQLFTYVPYQLECLTSVNLIAGFTISMALASVLLYGLYKLRCFFVLCSTGNIFTPESGNYLHSFSLSAILYAVLAIPVHTLLSVILTINNPPGERAVSISLSSTELSLVFLGGVFFVISWVIKESVRIAEDNAHFV